MPQQRQHWFEGWRLFFVLTLVLAGLCIWIAGMRQFEVEGVRMVIRFTARSSLVLFCLAFSAGTLARLWPNAWTRWQRRNRRYLGVSFAASHGIHAVAIASFAAMDPTGFMAATSAGPNMLRFCRRPSTCRVTTSELASSVFRFGNFWALPCAGRSSRS